MKVPFRQGIVRQQTDLTNNPTFLQQTPSGISINVAPDPTILAFAHGDADYLFEERVSVPNAWTGPFPVNQDLWLYWDIDVLTGERTFGYTSVQPVDGSSQPRPPIANDQHWFDITTMTMKVRQNNRWHEKIRVFAGKLDNGAILIPYDTGTQVGVNESVRCGFILFDDDDKAVKKFDRFGRGKFITTETPLSSQFSKLANFRLESAIVEGESLEHLPPFTCVAYKGQRQIGHASYFVPAQPCIGIVTEEIFPTEVRAILTHGYITDDSMNWTVPPGTKLFVGQTGELTHVVPQRYSIQQVATVVSPRTIYVDVQPLIFLDEA